MPSNSRIILAFLAISGAVTGIAYSQIPTCAGCQLALPPASPVNASHVPQASPTSQSFARITLSGVPAGFTLADGVYPGWSADDPVNPVAPSTAATPYSSYSPSLPVNIQSSHWAKVNWILNNKQGGFRDVQHAIWMALRRNVDPAALANFPVTDAVLAMYSGAQASGAAFVPGPGQLTAVILHQDGFGGAVQDTIVEARIPECGVIGDFVWQDTTRDGLQNESFTGLNGVAVRLRNASGVEIATTVTKQFGGQNGYYRFAGLCSGTYSVTVDTPSGMVQTFAAGGADSTADSNPQPASTTLDISNEVTRRDLTLDFGFHTPACNGKIGDLVWLDSNQNGIQDVNEPGIANLQLKLQGPGGSFFTNTDANGNYYFSGLCAGTYTITPNPVTTGNVPTAPLVGDDRGADSNTIPATVTVGDTTIDPSIDFGYKPACSSKIADRVWLDQNGNGVQDAGEPGIHGVTVELRQNNVVLQTAVTTNGSYLFSGVCAGNYTVVVVEDTLPPNLTKSESPLNTDPVIDSNPNPAPVNVPTNTTLNSTIDFGYRPAPCTASIGNFVWFDGNGNGIQDSGEPGLPDVRVELRDSSGAVVGSKLTSLTGFYNFTGLCADSYKVRVYNPSTSPAPPIPGLLPSPVNAGGNPAVDSNANNDTAVLAVNTSDQTYDFGFRPAGFCTRTQGYWKNHEEVWPVNSVVLGDRTYTQSELLSIFRMPVRGDSSISLAHQLIAAKLNLYAGASVPTAAMPSFAAADALLSGYGKKLPYGAKSNGMTSVSENLDSYNNGKIAGATHCK